MWTLLLEPPQAELHDAVDSNFPNLRAVVGESCSLLFHSVQMAQISSVVVDIGFIHLQRAMPLHKTCNVSFSVTN